MAQLPPKRIAYEEIEEAANVVSKKIPKKPLVGIICGAETGNLSSVLQCKIDIPYEEIPYCPLCKDPEQPKLIFGILADIPVACFSRRFHYYEGYSMDEVIFPVRLLKLLGVKYVINTTTANAVNKEYKEGDVMILKDHLNLIANNDNNPLRTDDIRWGRRPFTFRYAVDIRNKAKEVFARSSFESTVHEGVYGCLGRSNYKTLAEINMMKLCGADAVGVTSIHEILAAMRCGMDVLAICLIVNKCQTIFDNDKPLEDDKLLIINEDSSQALQTFLHNYIKIIGLDIEKDHSDVANREQVEKGMSEVGERRKPEKGIANAEGILSTAKSEVAGKENNEKV